MSTSSESGFDFEAAVERPSASPGYAATKSGGGQKFGGTAVPTVTLFRSSGVDREPKPALIAPGRHFMKHFKEANMKAAATVIAAAVAGLFSVAASAQTVGSEVQPDVQRNVNQQQRIEQGIQSGQLTNREAGKLERGQARVDRAEARAGADGHVGPNEQRRIQKAENKQSRRIYREKHDAQHR